MYCDSDWGGDNDTRKSTSGWIGFINGGPVTWTSRKQTVTATSTTEAEFVALCSATKTVMCTRKLLQEIVETQEAATSLYCDNQRAITLVNNPESSKRTKHIDIQYFYTCDMKKNNFINAIYISTEKQLADALTKTLAKEKFLNFVKNIGMLNE